MTTGPRIVLCLYAAVIVSSMVVRLIGLIINGFKWEREHHEEVRIDPVDHLVGHRRRMLREPRMLAESDRPRPEQQRQAPADPGGEEGATW